MLSFEGDVLADEMTLSEQGIRDRDRIEMSMADETTAAASAPSGNAAALDAVLDALGCRKDALDELEQRLRQRETVHQEFFTRVLEELDSINFDGCAACASTAQSLALSPVVCSEGERSPS